ncbi:allophanate hydrolase 2 subunit 2 [Vibrio maritimus]|uniref:Allophanate hydrolase 2 subunit 2 n=1 Tax=Vibrio maritimus TaxID=990268 RepID=A0A090SNH1_9VIBR|nr:allophanate hydrolase 2 subunit 2 [Vibrio maritimus]
MSIKVISGGPLSLVQDLGRFGHQSIGVTTGGPMDEHAFLWANRLLGNTEDAAQIEVTLGHFSCEFEVNATVAITGADLGVCINDIPIETWRTHNVNAGDRLRFTAAKKGLRAYIAVVGGFRTTKMLDSCATVMRDQLGGLCGKGKKLDVGDRINCLNSEPRLVTRVPAPFIPDYKEAVVLEVIPSYQYQEFSRKQRQRFFDSTYTITPQMDRMGCRLSGNSVEFDKSSLISEGIALGAIQIPADGQPIVLLKDRQTIGGYPKIGCLTNKSLNLLAQCTPGTQVQFVEKDIFQAESERVIEQRFFHHSI